MSQDNYLNAFSLNQMGDSGNNEAFGMFIIHRLHRIIE
jgi:hypothetical protein